MKKSLGLLIILAVFVLKTNAQTLDETNITGTWSVERVNNLIELPPEQKEQMEMLKAAFLESKFIFKDDKNFSFDFKFEDMRIKDAHWKYNDLTKSFIVQEWKDKETDKQKLMIISTKKEVNKIIFFLAESFFTLEMRKEK
ncbi:MAG: hypothetical protein P8Q14_06245 [Vicingaceae bacterium]|nr:hypothetical protein [Vicingaceae bacterium]